MDNDDLVSNRLASSNHRMGASIETVYLCHLSASLFLWQALSPCWHEYTHRTWSASSLQALVLLPGDLLVFQCLSLLYRPLSHCLVSCFSLLAGSGGCILECCPWLDSRVSLSPPFPPPLSLPVGLPPFLSSPPLFLVSCGMRVAYDNHMGNRPMTSSRPSCPAEKWC